MTVEVQTGTITDTTRLDLLETVIKPAALDLREEIAEEIAEAHEQLIKQYDRLNELAEIKAAKPGIHLLIITKLGYGANLMGCQIPSITSTTTRERTKLI